jgi:hypothetical protein
MGGLVAGGKGSVACGELRIPARGRPCGFVSRDVEARVWAGSFGIERGNLPTLLSAKAGQDL